MVYCKKFDYTLDTVRRSNLRKKYSKTETDFVSRWKSEEVNQNWTGDRDQVYEEGSSD
jgi:hypothetical protein